jgi:hypothetical protein
MNFVAIEGHCVRVHFVYMVVNQARELPFYNCRCGALIALLRCSDRAQCKYFNRDLQSFRSKAMAVSISQIREDFASLSKLSRAAVRLEAEDLYVDRPLPELHIVTKVVEVPSSTATAAPQGFSLPASGTTASAPLLSPAAVAEQDVTLPLTESTKAEIRRLEATVHELAEVNERIMAQNIALLADLECAQKAVRDLRAEKDVMAHQIKLLLQ